MRCAGRIEVMYDGRTPYESADRNGKVLHPREDKIDEGYDTKPDEYRMKYQLSRCAHAEQSIDWIIEFRKSFHDVTFPNGTYWRLFDILSCAVAERQSNSSKTYLTTFN